jgi:hypothetical protein
MAARALFQRLKKSDSTRRDDGTGPPNGSPAPLEREPSSKNFFALLKKDKAPNAAETAPPQTGGDEKAADDKATFDDLKKRGRKLFTGLWKKDGKVRGARGEAVAPDVPVHRVPSHQDGDEQADGAEPRELTAAVDAIGQQSPLCASHTGWLHSPWASPQRNPSSSS